MTSEEGHLVEWGSSFACAKDEFHPATVTINAEEYSALRTVVDAAKSKNSNLIDFALDALDNAPKWTSKSRLVLLSK